MRRALGEYYDRDMSEMLRWMKNSILVLAAISVTAPIVIFMSGWILAVYGILFIASIFYLIFSFVCYAVSNNNELLKVAEKSAEESEEHEKAVPEMSEKDRQRVEEAKRQMQAHPEWSNDTIAEHCGFGSRSYFQTVFRKQTGMTPSAFLENARVK